MGAERLELSSTTLLKQEQVVFSSTRLIPRGSVKLHLKFSGRLNQESRGFYISREGSHKFATTQFEPTEARRAFPCFDEPSLKATFSIDLVKNASEVAFSNMPIASDTPIAGAGKDVVRFRQTPRMSTYLVALLVGEFACLTGESDGTPIRVMCARAKNSASPNSLARRKALLALL